MGDNRAVPEVPRVEPEGDAQADRRPPRLRLHHLDPAVEHQDRRRDAVAATSASGRSCPTTTFPILAMRDTPWLVRDGEPFFPADCLADGGDAISCGIKRSEVLSDHNPTLDFVAQFPLLKPLDMSDAVCRPDYCRAVEGNVLIYHDSHHISTSTYMRTMTANWAARSAPPPAGG